MDNKIEQTMSYLSDHIESHQRRAPIPFSDFLSRMAAAPAAVIRNIFQTFHDMVRAHVGEGVDEYPDDPESIDYVRYDCSRLLVEDVNRPFFADRLFANRLIKRIESMRRGSQQNKIYIFEGPHGSGKSTFLNNLLRRFEQYANTEDGMRFETVWHLDRRLMAGTANPPLPAMLEKGGGTDGVGSTPPLSAPADGDTIEVPCPSHDHPLLMIPKEIRRSFLDELLENDEFKWKLYTEKEYEWVFRTDACTICTSIYQALIDRLKKPEAVHRMIYARPYYFNRRMGEGISVFNPGDKPMRETVLSNEMLQQRIDSIFRDSNRVNYIFSRFAKTNNGIYALMDIKQHNTDRLIELHNIISEGVHKVEDIEENVNSLLIALMNPEDKKNIEDIPSFSERIEYIKIPYVLDINTEVEIYRNIFGRHIDDHFLPRVLHNFARVIVSTRLSKASDSMSEWITNASKYVLYCDKHLQLLKMEIYTGHIPHWLSEEDRKRLTYKQRKAIIAESESEGVKGFSGRDSLKIFNDFFSTYAKEDKLINMTDLCHYFEKIQGDFENPIPEGFLNSLRRHYNYTVLQEVKESLYYYNEDKISRDIQNYLFAINFEIGSVERCSYTGQKLVVTEEFLEGIESKLLDPQAGKTEQLTFRQDTQREYTTKTLTQEILVEGKAITDTALYRMLHERYVYNIKEKVLDPVLENSNFRRAIKDFDTEDFKAYDNRIRHDVESLLGKLCEKFGYTQLGAREVSLYVIDAQSEKDDREPGQTS